VSPRDARSQLESRSDEKHGLNPMEPVTATLTHPGTGRRAALVQVRDFAAASPLRLDAGPYLLVIATEKQTVGLTEKSARAWIDAGASYVCAWGPDSPAIEEAFDYASFLPELGEPIPFTLMTTSHKSETLEDALWFAFYNATRSDEHDRKLGTVVVLVDSDILEASCGAWITENTE
jgi:hypothetical protein